MAGYISKFATGAAIEAILDKANNSQSVSSAEKSTWNSASTVSTDLTPVEMATNDNVDNYKISTSLIGHGGRKIWYCPSGGVADSLTNLPLDADTDLGGGFIIEYQQVKQNLGIQILKGIGTTATSNEPYVAMRSYDGSAWGTWYRFVSEARIQSYIGSVANNGAKNMLKNTGTTTTVGEVTFTVNADGSVTADSNGVATTANCDFDINNGAYADIPSGKNVILTGCPAGGSNSTYQIIAYQKSKADSGSGTAFTTTESNRMYIRIFSGVTVDNLTFYPMIREANIADATYVPYAPTNRELYEMIQAL